MAARRITYLVLLGLAVALHLVYGQYLTHYMVIFLLCLPLLSLLLSLPSAISARVELVCGEDVCRNRESSVLMTAESGSFVTPEGWSITVESQNAFTGEEPTRQRVRFGSVKKNETSFAADTSQLGCIKYRIKRAFIFERLGLIPIPVKKGGSVSITVLPEEERPYPEPDLIDASTRALRPKPQGFSEEHELRPYRDGDPLNLIHWKLSRKYDEFIIREPQEVIRKDIVLVADLPVKYEEHRSILEQHCYLHGVLFANEIPYMFQYGKSVFRINSANDYDDFIRGVLSEHMKYEKSPTPDSSRDALVYRIRPAGRKGASS